MERRDKTGSRDQGPHTKRFRESPLLDSILVCRAKPLFEPPLIETPPLFSICRGQGSAVQPCDQPCLKGRTPWCFRCLEVPLANTFSVLSPYGPNRQAEMLKLPRSESWHFGIRVCGFRRRSNFVSVDREERRSKPVTGLAQLRGDKDETGENVL